jgi:hypothetical protein
MKFDYIKTQQATIRRGLFALSIFLTAALFIKVAAFGYSSHRLSAKLQEIVVQNGKTDEGNEKILAERNKTVEKLKKAHIFSLPTPKMEPPVCMGIIGDSALFGEKLCKVGDELEKGKVLAIGPMDVKITWEGEEKTLVPFSFDTKYDVKKPGAPTTKPGQAPPVVVQSGPRPGGDRGRRGGESPRGEMRGRGMFNMSPEQMRQLRDQYMNMSPEERERFRAEQRERFSGRRPQSRRRN